MTTKCEMPSGNDYGHVIRWGWVDSRDFTVALSVAEADGKPPEFNWVVEHKEGDVVFKETRRPDHDPIFGVDEIEWRAWVTSMYPKIDAYVASKKVIDEAI